jgi:uncharacterized membrane protein
MQLDFHPVGGPWLVAIIATMLFALLGLVPTHIKLSAGRVWMLRILRLLAVVLVLLAMLRPTLKYTQTRTVETTLVVLVDGSRSMQVVDSLAGTSRWQSLRQLLGDASSDFARLGEHAKVKFVEFTRTTRPLATDAAVPTLADEPTGDESAIGAALADVLDSDERLLGVVLLSDGAQRGVAPRDAAPQIVARQLAAERVPLYTFTFGQPGGSDRADLAIDDLVIGDTLFAGAPARASGQLRSEGYLNQGVQVQLMWEDNQGQMAAVAATQVTPLESSARIPLSLSHTPILPGEYKVSLVATPAEGELVTTNNQQSTFVTVREGGIKILMLSGAKQPGGRAGGREQRFIRDTLATSPDMLVSYRLIDYQPAEIDLTSELVPDRWDVIVLDDVDSTGLNAASWRAMAELVSRGTGLVMLGGYHSFGPGGFRNNAVGSVLPIEIGVAERQQFGEAIRTDVHLPPPVVAQPTPLGLAHPILQIATTDGTEAAWAALPPLDGANSFSPTGIKSNGQVLLESAAPRRQPLLVAGQSGNGRVLAFAGDSTWRWQMEGHPEPFRRFWRQTMLWLAKKDTREQGRAYIELASRRISRGGLLEFEVGFDRPESETTDIEFEVVVTAKDGSSQAIETAPSGRDRRAGNYAALGTPGDYVVEVKVTAGDTLLDAARARFLVPDEDLELDRPAAEPALMAQLASVTAAAGGLALAPEELGSLIARLADLPVETTEEVLARITYWDKWPFFLAFVAVVGTEWWLRKRWGLV